MLHSSLHLREATEGHCSFQILCDSLTVNEVDAQRLRRLDISWPLDDIPVLRRRKVDTPLHLTCQ
jgi:hypothetical protein